MTWVGQQVESFLPHLQGLFELHDSIRWGCLLNALSVKDWSIFLLPPNLF